MKFLITGVAGFIGYHIAKRLLVENNQVVGIDNINDYYDISLKKYRLNMLWSFTNFSFYQYDLRNKFDINSLFKREVFDRVIHLGAQVGVRYSLVNPKKYIDTNIIGYLNILECCRTFKVNHLVYASSSSVYGLNDKLPFSIKDSVNFPISLYAVTKRSNELMSYNYAYLYNIPITGLRLFTVYGPWGRPDTALFKFTKSILDGKIINVYDDTIQRDFIFINDVVEAVIRIQNIVPLVKSGNYIDNYRLQNMDVPHRIYNVGTGYSIMLKKYINILELVLGLKAKKNLFSAHTSDILTTQSDIDDLCNVINFRPTTSLVEGITKFVTWYRNYYHI